MMMGTQKMSNRRQRKILLVVPPNITFSDFRHPKNNTKSWIHHSGEELGVIITDVPLGAITLSSWLKEKFNADVRVLDFNVLLNKTWNHPNEENFASWFSDEFDNLEFIPDIVGFSSLFVTGYLNLLELGKLSKQKYPNAMILAGGNVATTMATEIFQDDMGAFDALCYGEGELPFQELLTASNKDEYLEETNCWVTRHTIKDKGKLKWKPMSFQQ